MCFVCNDDASLVKGAMCTENNPLSELFVLLFGNGDYEHIHIIIYFSGFGWFLLHY